MLSFFRTALRTYRIQSWALSHPFCLPTTPSESVDPFPVTSPASYSPGFRRILGLRWSTGKAVLPAAHRSPSVICRAAEMNGGSTALEQLSECSHWLMNLVSDPKVCLTACIYFFWWARPSTRPVVKDR